jgi:hypothetical protein
VSTMNIPCIMCRGIVGIMEYANLATSGWLNLFTSGGWFVVVVILERSCRERERERDWMDTCASKMEKFPIGSRRDSKLGFDGVLYT